ncbi:uncharacterized protein ColSpa_08458 [Colletotrichum spaethianum]|uniref:RNA recognition domain-containing protein n=1 Tax=Colletotrichum spaethianum TaxID=700344 RepID=A0AA37P9T2_9PEZI|nr:uncharacterized protein ColSpa_08458 [Colletotrichum spaethianum]GKT48277.1 hypothetical protein ColSpa_08458 [Colletotrichum spaethianum]
MASTQSTSSSSQGGASLGQCTPPVGNAYTRKVVNNNAATSDSHDSGVQKTDQNTCAVNTITTPGSPNSDTQLAAFAPPATCTNVPAGGHNRMASSGHIIDQNAQIMDYNSLPGAQPPLNAQGPGGVLVQPFSQLTFGAGSIQYVEGVSDYSIAPNAQSSRRDSGSSQSWIHDATVTNKDSDTGAAKRLPQATGGAKAPGSMATKGEFDITTAAAAIKGKGKGKALQSIYTPRSSASSTRFSADHTSNHHIEARIETQAESAIGGLKSSGSNGGCVQPHLRGRTNEGQFQRPVREPVTPGPSTGVVPPNNFSRHPPGSSQANCRRCLVKFLRRPFNIGSNSASPARHSAAQQQHPGSAQSFNQTFSTFQGNGLVPRDRAARQAPVDTCPSAATSFGSAQLTGDAANTAGVIAGQGLVSFAPAGSFRPMNAVARPFHHPEFDSQRELKARLGISPNYAGDATIARNQSAPIPDSQNVAFWITNLPPSVTCNELLGQIHGMGRVWACVISPPTGNHITSAAKVVFFELAAAQKFYAYCTNPQRRLIIGGYVAHVCLNRTKKAEEDVGGNRSRVVIIMGDPSFVNPRTLLRWFNNHFEYEIDEIITHVLNNEMGHIEIRFGSWRSQAEASRQAIKAVYPPGGEQSPVWVFRYGTDPCSI